MACRNFRVAMIAIAMAIPAAGGDALLLTDAGLAAVREKAEQHEWARRAMNRFLQDAAGALDAPVSIPDRGGQWPHWYSCKRDGVRLRTVTPTRHECPRCGAAYSGDPYDAVVLYHIHSANSRAIRDLGLAWRLTGRREYSSKAARLLTAYADRYLTYPRHDRFGQDKIGGARIMAQTLDESVWFIPVAWGYALIRDTLTDAARTHIEKKLLLPGAEVIREHKLGIHNIQCWKNSAVGLIGFATGNPELIREAIDDPERGFRAQIAKGVTEEGLWWEGSLGYHQYTMQALWPLVEAASVHGIDLSTGRYRRIFDAPLALAFPNGDPPGFNDNRGGNVRNYAPLYELAYARWKDPRYGRVVAQSPRNSLEALLFGAADAPAGPLIPTESVLMKDSGFAMLRVGASALAMRFGRHGGGHGHPDKLNIVTFGAGRILGLDPGSIHYGVPLHQEWYKSTVAHNTVVVDERNQAPVDGLLENWRAEPDTATITASTANAYEGVSLRRTVTLQSGIAEDRFECSSGAMHTYDWVFHARGQLSVSVPLQPREALGDSNGYQHIRNLAGGRSSEDWQARWVDGDLTLTLHGKGEPDTEIFTGTGPGPSPDEAVPLLIIRRRAQQTVFVVRHILNR